MYKFNTAKALQAHRYRVRETIANEVGARRRRQSTEPEAKPRSSRVANLRPKPA